LSIFILNLVLRPLITFFYFLLGLASFSQTLGGNTAYNFLKLSPSPILTALGGTNISYRTTEVGISVNNPALLSSEVSHQLNTSFNGFLAGIRAYSLTGAYQIEKSKTTLGGHVYFIDYGKVQSTDASGNIIGEGHPTDFVVQFSAAKSYMDKWTYGGNMKIIQSNYFQYYSTAIAFDFGILFRDTIQKITIALLAKNMGFQLKTYSHENEDLPFDLQFGITKRLARAPLGFSLTAHHLHRFNLNYNDQNFNNENGVNDKGALNNLFNHLVAAAHVYLGQNIEALFGYDHLRRQELSTQDVSSGLSGFSAGLRVKYNQLQILYARSTYQKGLNYNQIGITISFGRII
jgi:hypothetical protein